MNGISPILAIAQVSVSAAWAIDLIPYRLKGKGLLFFETISVLVKTNIAFQPFNSAANAGGISPSFVPLETPSILNYSIPSSSAGWMKSVDLPDGILKGIIDNSENSVPITASLYFIPNEY